MCSKNILMILLLNQCLIRQIACFLHRELPVRLAHRAVELEETPVFKSSSSIRTVCNGYKRSFAEITSCPAPFDKDKEAQFARILEDIYERHATTLITMARGAHEIKTQMEKDTADFADFVDVQRRLDEFYLSRIGIRLVSSE
jgi:pyruvate dehydrogenase kinase 2/3/4